jgi:hypothetical protein
LPVPEVKPPEGGGKKGGGKEGSPFLEEEE